MKKSIMLEKLSQRLADAQKNESAWRRMMNQEWQSRGIESFEVALRNEGFLADITFRNWCEYSRLLYELEELVELFNR